MKINGRTPSGPNVVTIVLPRGQGEPWVFQARAVLDFSRFETLVPKPEPPKITRPGQPWIDNVDDETYQAAIAARSDLKWDWTIVQSLAATEGLEWDSVKEDVPASWALWEQDLRKAGFSWMECVRITNGVLEANCLDNEKVEEARKNFFASRSQDHPAG